MTLKGLITAENALEVVGKGDRSPITNHRPLPPIWAV